MEAMLQLIDRAALGVELLAVVIILVAATFGTLRFVFHLKQGSADAYKQYKVHLGKALLLALEFMVAADIIRTVALEQTIENIAMLLQGAIVAEEMGRWYFSTSALEPTG